MLFWDVGDRVWNSGLAHCVVLTVRLLCVVEIAITAIGVLLVSAFIPPVISSKCL